MMMAIVVVSTVDGNAMVVAREVCGCARTARAGETAVSGRAVADRDVERGARARRPRRRGGRRRAGRRRPRREGAEVVVATEDEQFEIAATLRATAFYDDLLERGEMPFPARFTAAFRRGIRAERERRALRERTTRKVGPALESRVTWRSARGWG